jgi:hypothetical protein
MAKKTSKRRHRVSCDISVPQMAKAGSSLRLVIAFAGEKQGEIVLGRGSFIWYGANRKIRKKIGWPRFVALMNEFAYGPER